MVSVSTSGFAADRQAIRDLIESWAVWRDTGDWARLRSVWHDDGRMIATWFEGTADQFIDVCRQGWSKGMRSWHALGGMAIDLSGARAVAQTKTTIAQRSLVGGVLCDVVSTGRFYDFLERRNERWGLVLRQPIYEKDRLDPVDPSAQIKLDEGLLSQFPAGYRHLGYVQTKAGYSVNRHLPGLDGPEIATLYREGERWLSGGRPLAMARAGNSPMKEGRLHLLAAAPATAVWASGAAAIHALSDVRRARAYAARCAAFRTHTAAHVLRGKELARGVP
jgi:hypothetical protein